ncbi:hypothetical protein TNCV_2845791 [Trichonephila clavipes]|nr:hypothetical protein TNCV_2845791 [Trichonephila clavipes]
MSVWNSGKPAIVRLNNDVPRRSSFTTNYYGSYFIYGRGIESSFVLHDLGVSLPYVGAVPFQQQRVCEIQLLQWFLYLSETPCKSPAEDAELGTVRVSQQPVELPDIQPDVDAELRTALVSQQLCELPHAPPIQAFAVRLVETTGLAIETTSHAYPRLDSRVDDISRDDTGIVANKCTSVSDSSV